MRPATFAFLVIPVCALVPMRGSASPDCPLAVPHDAGRFADLDSVEQLAGDYRLIQVAWQPAPQVTRGRLHLEVPDSAWREVPCGLKKMKRDLIGSYRADGAVPGPGMQALASRDPARPGVVVQGSSVRIGTHCAMDGGGDDLFITAVSAQGFWGTWSSDLGIAVLVDSTGHKFPDPAGFFCAIRQHDSTATVVGRVRDDNGLVSTDTTSSFTYEQFGIDLLRAAVASGSPESTRVVSPLSAGQVLALALAAAKDSTAFAIGRALHLGTLGVDGIAARSQRFNQGLRARRDVTLTVANALWVGTSASLQPAFEAWARQWYGAAVRRLPLRVPSIVPVVNAWADSATRGVIPRIRDKAFGGSTVVALTNAVYFKGLWLEPFDSARTQNRDFTMANGTRVATPTMERTGDLAYRRAPGYQALRVPYVAGLTAMYIVLPDSGVSPATVLEGLGRTGWPIPRSSETRSVALRLPRLHVAQTLDLEPPFRRLDLGIVFDSSRADFGGLVVTRPSVRIRISEATQQVYVDVDEKGTEAAAVTSLGFAAIRSAPPPPIPFFVDRPFFFLLRDERSGTFLFLGLITRP